MKKQLSFLFLVLGSMVSFAQNNEPLLMQQESLFDKIDKCRNITFQKAFNEADTASVCEMLEYAKNNLEGYNTIVFSIDEYRVLYLMTGQYKPFLETISVDDSVYYSNIARYRRPSTMNGPDLIVGWNQLLSNLSLTEENVELDAELTQEEKSFIVLYLKESNDDRVKSNKRADDFLVNNPGTKYEDYIRKYLRFEYDIYSKFGFEFAWQMGVRVNTGSLTDIDKTQFDFAGNAKLLYRRFMFAFDFAAGLGSLYKDAIVDNVKLESGTDISLANFGFTFGYKVPVINDNWYLSPSAGIQMSYLSDNLPPKESPEVYNYGEWKPMFSVEIGRDCFKEVVVGLLSGKTSGRYISFGLRYSYRPTEIHLRNGDYKGYSHSIGISAGLGFTRAKRVY